MKSILTFSILLMFGALTACATPPGKTTPPEVAEVSPPATENKPTPSPDNQNSDNVYYNAEAGFSITKPADWLFMNPKTAKDRADRARFDNEDLEALVKKSQTPLVVITRHPSPSSNYNPNVVVVLVPVPIEGFPLKSVMNSALGILKHSFSDLTLIDEIQETKVDGLESAYSKFKYTVTVNGRDTPLMARIWLVARGKIIFNIVMTGTQEIPNPSDPVFQEILDSIQISNPSTSL